MQKINKIDLQKLEELVRVLEKDTLRYRIIKEYFPKIPEADIGLWNVFLPLKMKVDDTAHVGIFFSEFVDTPCIHKPDLIYKGFIW